jgi:5'(3')-deoxyribonucleotidase
METDQVALIDLDSTLADYDSSLHYHMNRLRAPEEPVFTGRYESGGEPPHIEARRKLIQAYPGFWRDMGRIPAGFEVADELTKAGFGLHVLTKGPKGTPTAFTEKKQWVDMHLPNVPLTIGGDKSLVYGKVLVDDFPHYFEAWLRVRPRGLVIAVAQPWNADYAKGGKSEHSNVFRFDDKSSEPNHRAEMRALIQKAYSRQPKTTL